MFKLKGSLLIFVFLLTISFVFAQDGSSGKGRIQGYITDEATGDILPGANVSIEGTGLGASTDLNGKYVIEKVPAGSYTINVRYIGYQNKEALLPHYSILERSVH